MAGRPVQALGWLGPLAAAAALVLLIPPAHPQAEVARPAPEALGGTPVLGGSLDPGRVRGWQRSAGGWLLRFQPDHGAWLAGVWVPDAGGPPVSRLEAASWLPGARLSARAAACWGGDGPSLSQERLGRRDWSVGGQTLAGALPAGGPLPRSGPPPLSLGNALLAGLLLAGALARRLAPGPADPVWIGLAGVGCVSLAMLAPSMSPLAGRLYAAEVRPEVTALAWSAGVIVLMGGVLFTAIMCPSVRGPVPMGLLPWGFLLGLAVGRHEPVGWIAELASLPGDRPTLAALALVAAWLVGLAGEGLAALLEPLQRARWLALIGSAALVVLGGGTWVGPGLVVLVAAAAGRKHGTWMGLAAMTGMLAGSLGAVCLWPAAQWLAGGVTVAGLAFLMVARLLAVRADPAVRVQSGG